MDDRSKHALLALIEGFLDTHTRGEGARVGQPVPDDLELQMSAAALMVCIVRADRTSRQDEHRVLEKAIGQTLGLDADGAARVVRMAEEKLGEHAPFKVFIDLLNQGCSADDKKRLLEWLWRIAFADAELAAHEEYLVRKVAEHLHLTTADLVEAKIRARDSFLREDI